MATGQKHWWMKKRKMQRRRVMINNQTRKNGKHGCENSMQETKE